MNYVDIFEEFWNFDFLTYEGNETDTESYSYDPQPSMSGIHSYDFRHDIYGLKKNFVSYP